jgi:hypothetical protein
VKWQIEHPSGADSSNFPQSTTTSSWHFVVVPPQARLNELIAFEATLQHEIFTHAPRANCAVIGIIFDWISVAFDWVQKLILA